MAQGQFDRATRAIFGMLALTFILSPVQAAAQAQLSPQELNPAQLVRGPQKPSGNRDLLSPPEPGPCPLASSNLTFKLNSVTFNGAATVPPEVMARAYDGYLGRDVPVSALCQIRDRASTILFDEGLFARVEIPAQKISEGHVVLDVIEAYIASVRVRGDDSGAQSKVEDYIEMLRGMKPFNIRLAQRYLFLASDVPGVAIAATLRPAGKGRGAIELVITVRRKPIDAIVAAENFGAQSTGPWGALARVDFNGFTPFGERSTIVGYQTFDLKEQRVVEAIEEARIGDDGLLGHVSFSWGETHPGDQLAQALLFGQSFVTDAELSYPIVRMRSQNLTITGGFEAVDEKVSSDMQPLTQDRIRVFFLRANGDIAFGDELPVPLKLDGNVEIRQGAPILGASKIHVGGKPNPALPRVGDNPDAFVLRGEAHATVNPVPMMPTISLTEHVQGQYTDVPLVTYEQQSIGNLTIGRGYDPSAVTGDRAIASATDLRFSPYLPNTPVTGSVFGFFDIAQVWNLVNFPGVNRDVRSWGGGITIDILKKLHVETIYAHPMDKISINSSKRPPDRILISVTADY